MKLTKITIKNLRCIEDESFDLYDLTTLIGPNNCGKSVVIRAIEIFLNQERPHEDEWNENNREASIVIEGLFTDIKEEERDIPGIASLVYNAQIRLKLTITKTDKNPEFNYEAFIREENIDGWSENWSPLSDTIKEIAQTLEISGTVWRNKGKKERVREYIRKNRADLITYGEAGWTDEGISITVALQQGLPRAEIIPAVKDAREEGQVTQKKNIFKDLLDGKIYPEIEKTEVYQTMTSAAGQLQEKLRDENDEDLAELVNVSTDLSNRMKGVIDLKVLFRLDPPDIKKILGSSAKIKLSDGTETQIQHQGHGAQRAFIYSLIDYMATQKSAREGLCRPVILLFEEPEIYMHPQLLRLLKNSLKLVAQREQWQVLISTHSPIMIEVADNPKSLIILRRENESRRIIKTQLQDDPFSDITGEINERDMLRASLDFHPTVCEVFFAKHAVLVEGDSEKAIFQYADKILKSMGHANIKHEDVTIVSCGGKWTILPIARLLNAFQIPYKVIHDMDRKGMSAEELAQKRAIDPYKANEKIKDIAGEENIFVIEDTLEDILFEEEDKKSKDKPYTAWVKIKTILENNDLDNYEVIKNMFKFVYNLS